MPLPHLQQPSSQWDVVRLRQPFPRQVVPRPQLQGSQQEVVRLQPLLSQQVVQHSQLQRSQQVLCHCRLVLRWAVLLPGVLLQRRPQVVQV
jgi:hypothetical protein